MNKERIKQICIASFFLFSLISCNMMPGTEVQNTLTPSSPTMHILTAKDNGSVLTLKAGDSLQVKLAGNITTGFSWEVAQVEPGLLQLVGEPAYQAEEKGLMVKIE